MEKDMRNVGEAWPLVDTINICRTMYGREATVRGWFTTFANFFAHGQHSLFKDRTAGICGASYNNQQIADQMDYAFVAYSLGLSFFGPCQMQSALIDESLTPDGLQAYENFTPGWWQAEVPRHCALQFKVNQDIILELNSLMAPPGYGPVGGGFAFELPWQEDAPVGDNIIPQNALVDNNVVSGGDTSPVAAAGYEIVGAVAEGAHEPGHKEFSMAIGNINQGPACREARWAFAKPIEIPRTATIEAVLHVSDFIRAIGAVVSGPQDYFFRSDGAADYKFFPQRFGVQASLYGVRYVQQRGQYHR